MANLTNREQWLEQRGGRQEKHVLTDDKGKEYIVFDHPELGSEREYLPWWLRKKQLPQEELKEESS